MERDRYKARAMSFRIGLFRLSERMTTITKPIATHCVFYFYSILIMVSLLVHTTPVQAQTPKATSSQANSIQLVLYLMADTEIDFLKNGINLLLQDRLQKHGISCVPLHEILIQARKGNILKPKQRILVQDLPYLTLTTHANRTALGWLKQKGDSISLVIRNYDQVNPSQNKAIEITQTNGDVGALVARSTQGLIDIYGETKTKKNVPDAESYGTGIAEAIGRGWKQLSEGNALEGLNILTNTRRLAGNIPQTSIPNVVELEHLITEISNKAQQLEASTMLYDLTDNEEQANRSYSKLNCPSKSSAMLCLDYASWLLRNQRLEEAQQFFDKGERIYSSSADYYALKGDFYLKQKQSYKLTRAWKKAVQLGTTRPDILEHLASTRNRKNSSKLYSQAGDLYFELRDFVQSNRCYMKAIKRRLNLDLLDRLKIALLDKKQLEYLSEILSPLKDRANRSILLTLAQISQAQGDVPQAINYFESAAEIAPNDFAIQLQAANYLAQDKRSLRKAQYLYKHIVDREPQNLPARIGLVWILLQDGNLNLALNTFQKILELEPNAEKWQLEHARLQIACGEMRLAKRTLQALLKTYPDHVEALAMQADLSWKLHDRNKLKRTIEQLKAVAPDRAAFFESLPEPPKQILKRPPIPTKSLNFPEILDIADILPRDGETIGLFDYNKAANGESQDGILSLLAFTNLNVTPVWDDLKRILDHNASVQISPRFETYLKEHAKQQHSSPSNLEILRDFAAKFNLDAAVGLSLQREKRIDGADDDFTLHIYSYIQEEQDESVLEAQVLLVTRRDQLLKRNHLAFGLISIFILLVVVLFSYRRKGPVHIDLQFDRPPLSAIFVIQLSRAKSRHSLNVSSLYSQQDLFKAVDIDRQLVRFFKRRATRTAASVSGQLVIPHVSAGKHHLTILTLILDARTRKLIGSEENHILLSVDPYSGARVNRAIKLKQALVSIRPKWNQPLTEAIGANARTRGDFAQIEIDGDPLTRRQMLRDETQHFLLPTGSHRVYLRRGNLRLIHDLPIETTNTIKMELSIDPVTVKPKPLDPAQEDTTSSAKRISEGIPTASTEHLNQSSNRERKETPHKQENNADVVELSTPDRPTPLVQQQVESPPVTLVKESRPMALYLWLGINDRDVLPLLLHDLDIAVITVSSQEEAIHSLEMYDVDLILSDVPKQKSQWELYSLLKSYPDTSFIPIVFYSPNELSEEIVKHVFSVGCDDVLLPPLRAYAIDAKLERLIMSSRSNRPNHLPKAPISPRSEAALSGDLSEVAMADIIQLLSATKKSGALMFEQQQSQASLFFKNGAIIQCIYQDSMGEKAFYDLLTWTEGNFHFDGHAPLPKAEIYLPTESLLLEGYRLIDESNAKRI